MEERAGKWLSFEAFLEDSRLFDNSYQQLETQLSDQ